MRVFRPKLRAAFTLIELLVVIAIIGVLIGLLVPAVQAAREAARRSQCTNNLKQQALALHNFAEAFGTLPSSIRPPTGVRTSWETFTLPYLDQQSLYDKIDQTANWSAATANTGFAVANSVIVGTRVSAFECPSSLPSQSDPFRYDDDGDPKSNTTFRPGGLRIAAPSDYAATTHVEPALATLPAQSTDTYTQYNAASTIDSVGPGILQKNAKPRLADVRDGLSNTILLTESAGRPWVWQKVNSKLVKLGSQTSSGLDIVSSNAGDATTTVAADRINGGGWARPASDISLLGSDQTGKNFPGYYINRTNGVSINGASWAAATEQLSGTLTSATLASGATVSSPPYVNGGSLTDVFNLYDPLAAKTSVAGTGQPFSFHPGGLHVALGDGSVKFVSENIPIRLFARLVTRDQDEPVDASSFESFPAH